MWQVYLLRDRGRAEDDFNEARATIWRVWDGREPMHPKELAALAIVAQRVTVAAGAAILRWYAAADPGATEKADASPLTRADTEAHDIILAGLSDATPVIPVLSEEGHHAPAEERRHWRRCWIVDPLDGTREFLARNDQFTVNVALVEDGRPLLGVVGVPAQDMLYLGVVPESRAERVQLSEGRREAIRVRRLPVAEPPVVLASRSHRGPELEALMRALSERFPGLEERQVGSALKLVELACGRADGYPRRGPCSEWDIAAGEAVLLAAGGRICRRDGGELRYNKPDSLLNPDFWAVGDPEGPLADAFRELFAGSGAER